MVEAEAVRPDWASGLPDRQWMFVEEYLIDLNGTQAAIRAGYSVDSAASEACRLLRNAKIAAAVDGALSVRPGVTRARIVEELAAVGFADIRDVIKWRGMVSQTGETEDGEPILRVANELALVSAADLSRETAATISEISQAKDGTIKVKLHDKLSALDKLGRTLGMFKDRVSLENPDGSAIEPSNPREVAKAILAVLGQAHFEDSTDIPAQIGAAKTSDG